MAKIKFSEEVEPINNKHYGFTFMRNHYGNSMQPASRSSRTRYSNQFQRMQNLEKAAQFWRNMTPGTVSNWENFAATFPQPSKRSSVVSLSGYQLFLKRNHYLFLNNGINSNFMETPAMEAASEPLITFTLNLVSGRLYIIPTYSFYDSNIITQLFLNRVSSPGLFYTGTKTRYMATAGNVEQRIVNYGNLYNGHCWEYSSGSEIFGIPGFHVPSFDEYLTLRADIGGYNFGYRLKETGFVRWNEPNTEATNDLGFYAVGAGIRGSVGIYSQFKNVNDIMLTNNTWVNFEFQYNSGWIWTGDTFKRKGISVRLLKNDSSFVPTVTDFDGNIYNCVQIGSQIWTVQNFACNHFSEGTPIPTGYNNSEWAVLTSPAYAWPNGDENNVFSGSDPNIDITENYLKYFGKLPAVGDILTLKYFSTTVNSAHFFPVRYVRLTVQ